MKPLIGIPANCNLTDFGTQEQRVSTKYARAVWELAQCTPLVLPSWDWGGDLKDLANRLDGLVLTGARANVHPRYYAENKTSLKDDELQRAAPFDEDRDALVLPLLNELLDQGKPVFAICRGLQELNVALGGSLHAKLQELPGRFDHRMPKTDDMAYRFALAHDVTFRAGGPFDKLNGGVSARVNSLHGQAIDRLADRLLAEGTAEDGTIEAVSVADAPGFALGVQWHAEHEAADNALSLALFRAFGQAAQSRAECR